MKKFLRIFTIVIGLILVAMIVLPFAFKGKIKAAVKDAANENLTAVLDFSDVSVSLFRNFPNLSVRIFDLSLTGTEDFDGIRLVEANRITATVDLWSVFGETIAVKEISTEGLKLDVRVMADGRANYDIAKPSEPSDDSAVTDSDQAGGFSLELNHYELINSSLRYEDLTYPMLAEITEFDHSGNGDFTLDRFLLTTSTKAKGLTFVYDGVGYIRNSTVELEAGFDIDLAESRYTFADNRLLINRLPLHADGWVAMPGDDIDMDITFSSQGGDLLALLSMVPAEFAQDLDGVNADGRIDFNGFIRGTYNETTMPGFGLNLTVNNGRFSYPDLPESVENIEIKLRVDASQGIDHDGMTIDLDKCYMELANNPVSLTFHLRNPYTDLHIESDIAAKVNFEKLGEVVPLQEGDRLSGSLTADLHFKGRMSALDEEHYEDFEAAGELMLLDTKMALADLPYDVELNSVYLRFSPQFAELTTFESRIGDSDLSADGRITNYLQYVLRDELLHGRFNVRSNYMDLNAFIEDSEPLDSAEDTDDSTETPPMGIIRLPDNVDFTLNARFDRLHYDNLDISNARGSIVLRNKVAILSGMNLDMLDGSITVDGTYDSGKEQPEIDMKFVMKNVDIQEAVNTFYTIEKMAPLAKSTTGRFTTTLAMSAELDEHMMPIENTITGGGKLQTNRVHIEKFEPLNKMAAELGIDRLSKQTIENVNLTYRFEDGRIGVDPFTVKLEGIETTIAGSMSFSQELDYDVKMTIPTSMLPGNLAGQASNVLRDLNERFGSNLSVGGKLPVNLKVTGTVESPIISANYGEQLKQQGQDLKEQVKDAVKEVIEDKIDEARDAAIAQARAEADKIISDAQTRANRMVAEATTAANNLRNSAYGEAQKVEDSAKNPIERVAKKAAADKMRQEADTAQKRAIDEAQKRANDVMKQANEQAAGIIAAAEKQ